MIRVLWSRLKNAICLFLRPGSSRLWSCSAVNHQIELRRVASLPIIACLHRGRNGSRNVTACTYNYRTQGSNSDQDKTFPLYLQLSLWRNVNMFMNMYLYTFDGVVITSQCTATFLKIYCTPLNRGITRTWICRLNFAKRLSFSGLRFFNEPEISDSGPPA